MDITLDFSALIEASQQNPAVFLWYLFVRVGWFPVLFILGKYFWDIRLKNLQHHYLHSIPFTLLAIDVPKLNEQSSKAVEQIFAQLGGAASGANLIEKYLKGKVQESFSLELISLNGYIQFLIRTPTYFRDLVEAAVYAQYPDAEITEVEDYVTSLPRSYPSEDYELWGTELKLVKPDCYPIRTYPSFEHALTQKYADPMAAVLEIMSHLGPGENLMMQWVITPGDDHWKEHAEKEVKKLIGAKVEHKESLYSQAMKGVNAITGNITEVMTYGIGSTPVEAHGAEVANHEPHSLITFLSPGERAVVEAIEIKMTKMAYHVKPRIIYLAKREVYNKAKGVAGALGALQQYSALNLNGFAPIKKITTAVNYFMIKRRVAERQRKIAKAFRERNSHAGWGHGIILNIEELATVWHFPVSPVKSPLVKTSETKRGEPPVGLPVEGMDALLVPKEIRTEESHESPPDNLPV